METWLEEVRKIETEHDTAAVAKAKSDREVSEETERWLHDEIVPAMHRFASDLRTLGRVVEVRLVDHTCRVEVRDAKGLTPEFTAEIGTVNPASTNVRDQFPTMSAVFHGVNRLDVKGERVYELLKESYLSKLKSRPA